MSSPRTLVVIPVHNEAQSLPPVLAELKRLAPIDVLVVDDCSADGTALVAVSHGAKVLPLSIRLGAWGAIQTGLRYARKRGYTYVLTMDGDGQHNAQEIPALFRAMGCQPPPDVIIGSCLGRGSSPRQFAWSFFRTLTGIQVGDLTSGFRLYNEEAIAVLAQKEATLLDFQDVGVLLMLRSGGLSICETNVSMRIRQNGQSRIFSSWLRVFYYMLSTTILSLSKIGRSHHLCDGRAQLRR